MSDHVSRRPRLLGRTARAVLLVGLLGLLAGPAAPLATAAGGLTITTPFPAVVAEPGSTASFALTIDVPSAQRVDLKTTGVPQGWTARFRGGGLTIDSVYVNPKSPPSVTLDVEIPDGTPAGSTNIVVTASGGGNATRCRSRSGSPTRRPATSRSRPTPPTSRGHRTRRSRST